MTVPTSPRAPWPPGAPPGPSPTTRPRAADRPVLPSTGCPWRPLDGRPPAGDGHHLVPALRHPGPRRSPAPCGRALEAAGLGVAAGSGRGRPLPPGRSGRGGRRRAGRGGRAPAALPGPSAGRPWAAGRPGDHRRGPGAVVAVLVCFDPSVGRSRGVVSAACMARAPAGDDGADEPVTVVVPTAFDGPDLEEVARPLRPRARSRWSRLLTGARLEVAVLGFSPGFAYLEGLPAPLARVARRDRPRPVVGAGSVALAGGFAAIYPQSTPGGWHLVGRTGLPSVRPDRDPLSPCSGRAMWSVSPRCPWSRQHPTPPDALGSAGPPADRTPGLLGRNPGLLDPGPGPGPSGGGPPGGAAGRGRRPGGPPAGQPPGRQRARHHRARGHGPGPSLPARATLHVAVVGPGDPVVTLDGREVGPDGWSRWRAGQRLCVGAVRAGLRAYVAVAGRPGRPGGDGQPLHRHLVVDRAGSAGGPGDELGLGRPGRRRGAGRPLGARGPGPGARPPGPAGAARPPPRLVRARGPGPPGARGFVVDHASDRVGLRLRWAGYPGRPRDGGPGSSTARAW